MTKQFEVYYIPKWPAASSSKNTWGCGWLNKKVIKFKSRNLYLSNFFIKQKLLHNVQLSVSSLTQCFSWQTFIRHYTQHTCIHLSPYTLVVEAVSQSESAPDCCLDKRILFIDLLFLLNLNIFVSHNWYFPLYRSWFVPLMCWVTIILFKFLMKASRIWDDESH